MKTLVPQPQPSTSPRPRYAESPHSSAPKVRRLSPTSMGIPALQRKSSCACGGGCPRCQEQALLQTKLKISEPDDEYEQEADRIADEVMRMPEPSVQRQMESEEEEDEDEEEEIVQRKAISGQIAPLIQRQVLPEMEEEEDLMQRKENNNQPSVQDSSVVHEVLNSPGEPLDSETRAFMESRFGHDFSEVKIHSGHQSAQSACSINALAYTANNNVVFGEGQYQPGTSSGRKLLAHELTHVVQQGGSKAFNSSIFGSQIWRQPITEMIQRYPGCSTAQDRAINIALARARRRSSRAIQAIIALQSGSNLQAGRYLSRYFGSLTPAQITSVRTRMEAADARLHNAAVWQCDTATTFLECGPPNSWCAGTPCPTTTAPTHLCPPVFRPERDRACAEPSRAILLEHEALRAAGACGGHHPPVSYPPPNPLDNVYSYSRFMFSSASGSP